MSKAPLSQNERQKCFIGLSQHAGWYQWIVSVFKDILDEPDLEPWNLEPWEFEHHFDENKHHREEIVAKMIETAPCGIYDISYWRKQGEKSQWVMPRDVFIELGIAIGLNRPVLLLQNEESQKEGPALPECLRGFSVLSFNNDEHKKDLLKKTLEEYLSNWVNVPPDRQWKNHFCLFGWRACSYRDIQPYSTYWTPDRRLPILVAHGRDQHSFSQSVKDMLDNYYVQLKYLNESAKKHDYLLCACCQAVRSDPISIYRLTPETAGETFIAIGISIAVEYVTGQHIHKLILASDREDVPLLLQGYDVALAKDPIEEQTQLHESLPVAYSAARNEILKKSPGELPYQGPVLIPSQDRSDSPLTENDELKTGQDSGDGDTTNQIQTDQAEAYNYNQQGVMLYDEKRFDEALLAFEQATQRDSGKAPYFYNKGLALYELHRHNEALAAYGQAIQLAPDHAMAYGAQGIIYAARKEYQLAIQCFSRALELDATLSWAKTRLEEARRNQDNQAASNAQRQATISGDRYQLQDPTSTSPQHNPPSGRQREPNLFLRVQKFVEEAMERISAVGPGELQPAEIAHKLINAMEDNLQLQAGGIRYAPNVYDIYLSREDHARLAPGQATLIDDWRRELENIARQRHYLLRTSLIIRLHPDSGLPRRLVRVSAEHKDSQPSSRIFNIEDLPRVQASQPDGAASQPFSYPNTDNSDPINKASTRSVPPHAWLTIRLPGSGQQIYRIEKPEINIGRQRNNDIIVEDKRVSRLHATISYQNGQYILFDRGSVNGILINGRRFNGQHALRSRDYFTIGSYDFYFDERR